MDFTLHPVCVCGHDLAAHTSPITGTLIPCLWEGCHCNWWARSSASSPATVEPESDAHTSPIIDTLIRREILDAAEKTEQPVLLPGGVLEERKKTAAFVDLTGHLQKSLATWGNKWYQAGDLSAGYRVEVLISANVNAEPPHRLVFEVGEREES